MIDDDKHDDEKEVEATPDAVEGLLEETDEEEDTPTSVGMSDDPDEKSWE